MRHMILCLLIVAAALVGTAETKPAAEPSVEALPEGWSYASIRLSHDAIGNENEPPDIWIHHAHVTVWAPAPLPADEECERVMDAVAVAWRRMPVEHHHALTVYLCSSEWRAVPKSQRRRAQQMEHERGLPWFARKVWSLKPGTGPMTAEEALKARNAVNAEAIRAGTWRHGPAQFQDAARKHEPPAPGIR